MKISTKLGAGLGAVGALLFLTGCPTPASLSPGVLTLPPQLVNPGAGASTPQTVTLKAGGASHTVSTITVTAPYSQTNNCPSSLAANATCTIEVSIAPNAVGPINGVLEVSGGGLSLRAVLIGTGLAPVGVSPSSLDFGTVAVGQASATQTVTLTNNQSAALAIQAITASGNYTQSNNCTATLAPAASCNISVGFTPGVKGTLTGAISVATDASLAAQPVGLTGVGSGTTTAGISLSPASLDFGLQAAGTKSAARTVTLTNTSSNGTVTITSVSATAGYTSTDTCSGKMIAANGTCEISVTFQPAANLVPISYSGAITVVDSDPTGAQIVGLAGSGVAPVSPSTTSLDFGTILLNTTSTPKTVTFTNVNNVAETLTPTAYSPFAVGTNTCTNNLAPGGKCSVDLTFGPSGVGTRNGVMTGDFSSGGFLTPQVVNLSACVTEVSRNPQSLNFGAVPVGKTSDPETVTISGGVINFSGVALAGANAAEFAISNNTCTGALNGGACTVELTFTPTASGVRTASLQIADDKNCSPQTVSLTGGSSTGPFVLTGILNGTGSGNLTSAPAGLNCGSQGTLCSASFATGTSVSVTATPDSTSNFAGWSVACSGTGKCNTTMSADRQATATFNLNPSLVVNVGGNAAGTGTVTSSPAGISCQLPQGGACQAYFLPGTPVQLTASAGSGSVFAGWNGGCSGTSTCAVTMSADQTVGAIFNGPPTITVGLSGTGSGTVVSKPAGINCPTQCSASFPSGTAVSLSATAGSGSGFDGWTGPCSSTGSCSFSATSDQSVGAAFDLPDFSVTTSPSTTPTVIAGGSATFSVAVGALGGYNNSVTLGCSAPAGQGVNCTVSPTSVKPGGASTLTVTTTGPSGSLAPLPWGTRPSGPIYAGWILLPAFALVGAGSTGLRIRRRRLIFTLACLLLIGLVGLQIACSSGSGPASPGTPAGTYMVNVNATSGSASHSTSVNITVQ